MAEEFIGILGSVFEDEDARDSDAQWGYLFQVKGPANLFDRSETGKQFRITVEEVSGGEGQAQQGDAEGQAPEA